MRVSTFHRNHYTTRVTSDYFIFVADLSRIPLKSSDRLNKCLLNFFELNINRWEPSGFGLTKIAPFSSISALWMTYLMLDVIRRFYLTFFHHVAFKPNGTLKIDFEKFLLLTICSLISIVIMENDWRLYNLLEVDRCHFLNLRVVDSMICPWLQNVACTNSKDLRSSNLTRKKKVSKFVISTKLTKGDSVRCRITNFTAAFDVFFFNLKN